MKFNPETHKVIVDTLSQEESSVFIGFLEYELGRHSGCLVIARSFMSKRFTEIKKVDTYIRFWQSAEIRHLEDVEEIKKLIQQVKEKI